MVSNMHSKPYWLNTISTLKILSSEKTLYKCLSESGGVEELIIDIFDHFRLEYVLEDLPKQFTHIKNFGGLYLNFVECLLGYTDFVEPDAPIYQLENQTRLYKQTNIFISLIEEMISALDND